MRERLSRGLFVAKQSFLARQLIPGTRRRRSSRRCAPRVIQTLLAHSKFFGASARSDPADIGFRRDAGDLLKVRERDPEMSLRRFGQRDAQICGGKARTNGERLAVSSRSLRELAHSQRDQSMDHLRTEALWIFVRQAARSIERRSKIFGFQRCEHLFRKRIVLRWVHEFFRRRKLVEQAVDRRVRRGGASGGERSAND